MKEIKIPRGRRPKHIADLLNFEQDGKKVYEGMQITLVCPTCGRWADKIDHYWPYHLEQSWCKDCGAWCDQ